MCPDLTLFLCGHTVSCSSAAVHLSGDFELVTRHAFPRSRLDRQKQASNDSNVRRQRLVGGRAEDREGLMELLRCTTRYQPRRGDHGRRLRLMREGPTRSKPTPKSRESEIGMVDGLPLVTMARLMG